MTKIEELALECARELMSDERHADRNVLCHIADRYDLSVAEGTDRYARYARERDPDHYVPQGRQYYWAYRWHGGALLATELWVDGDAGEWDFGCCEGVEKILKEVDGLGKPERVEEVSDALLTLMNTVYDAAVECRRAGEAKLTAKQRKELREADRAVADEARRTLDDLEVQQGQLLPRTVNDLDAENAAGRVLTAVSMLQSVGGPGYSLLALSGDSPDWAKRIYQSQNGEVVIYRFRDDSVLADNNTGVWETADDVADLLDRWDGYAEPSALSDEIRAALGLEGAKT